MVMIGEARAKELNNRWTKATGSDGPFKPEMRATKGLLILRRLLRDVEDQKDQLDRRAAFALKMLPYVLGKKESPVEWVDLDDMAIIPRSSLEYVRATVSDIGNWMNSFGPTYTRTDIDVIQGRIAESKSALNATGVVPDNENT